ncbi:MAG: hypothetical protein H6Q69_156 [Firmicutes bacterium]|jgi:methoxymalonate biosynthesis acyl carrier protein|nr:hypothetical protein [Bacillota bacterium]
MPKENEQKLRDFFAKFIEEDVDNDTDIFGSGLINSLFAMQLVLFIEKEFHLKVEHDDLDIENFKSIHAITNFIQTKQSIKEPASK